jgi:8-oxo-dGTP diphosphatase
MKKFNGALYGQEILFISNLDCFIEPNCALILAIYEGKLIFTKHQKRGWELPGGTRQSDEKIIETAIRELYEETGAEVATIEPIGQYIIFEFCKLRYVKTIFISEIKTLHPIPNGFETNEIKLLKSPPKPEEILEDDSYSPLLKDMVYATVLTLARKHRYCTFD